MRVNETGGREGGSREIVCEDRLKKVREEKTWWVKQREGRLVNSIPSQRAREKESILWTRKQKEN